MRAIDETVAGFPFLRHGARDWKEDARHENGNYTCICSDCGETFMGHKRRVICKTCSHKEER